MPVNRLTSRLVCLCALITCLSSVSGAPLIFGGAASTGADTAQAYTHRTPSPDGIGKVYLGREISQVMGHRGAAWLERPERAASEQPDLLVKNLPLRPNDVFADIGAGTGYFTFRVSPRIPEGKVLAVDIQPEMLAIIEQRKQETGAQNVVLILGSPEDPHLPEASVDLALMVDAYHEFSHPREMMDAIVKALKPGGLVVLVEYRAEDPNVRRKPLHKMTEAQVRRELAAAGLRWRETRDFLRQQHFIVFVKP